MEPGPGQPLTGNVNLDAWTWHNAKAGYYGLINQIDDQVGRIMNALSRMKLAAGTAIVFCSDHGEMLGDHHQWGIRHPYEPVLHGPLFLHLPRWLGYPAGVVSDRPVGLRDIGPTLLELAGVPIPDAVTGRSLLPLARGEAAGWRTELHCEHNWPGGAVRLPDPHRRPLEVRLADRVGQEQLFDHGTDPLELHDLARDCPDLLASWRAKLVETLRDRPEGFVDGDRLVPGGRTRRC
ncbi:MAG: sulfatase-like hydrolase/transferase [Gammaproteobacteria bacterium]|nr:sulfatase-like hydrolase/transferase [Gammaproteobacteria bacterium]